MNKVYIAAAGRTAIGSYGGSLKTRSVSELGGDVIRRLLSDSEIEGKDVDEVVLGNVLSAGQGMGPARQASIGSGIPVEVPAYGVNMLCGSGMKAVMIGAGEILLGNAAVTVCGGMENMSLAPYLVPPSVRFGARLGSMEMEDHIIKDGLTDYFNNYHMGITAENIASKYDISRREQDSFALESQKKAVDAVSSGRFRQEIHPVKIRSRKGELVFDVDEYPRADASMESLEGLHPAFDKQGTVTAGNASGINDGAAALVLASGEMVKERGFSPLAEIIGWNQAGVDPAFMGLGPVPAVSVILKKSGMNLGDIDLIELNEAFAAQALGVVREFSSIFNLSQEKIMEKTNVNGGAIALGHPLGASGARIIVTLIHELRRRKAEIGLASLCVGGGMGTAVLIRAVG